MTTLTLFYATNRNHEGKDRWRPRRYGKKFSDDGIENLRFGRLTLEVDEADIDACLAQIPREGEALADHLTKLAASASIQAYREKLDSSVSEAAQRTVKLGSRAMFGDLQTAMRDRTDVLVYIHGFNVSWEDAVGAALSLQIKLNRSEPVDVEQSVQVVLFSWPSDGMALPYTSYRSDRSEAAGSGKAVGRAFLKLRDYLAVLQDRTRPEERCEQDIHLLCHSMGNYVLQEALRRLDEHSTGNALPRLFEHILLCAADVDDDALEPGRPMNRVHELARSVSIYHNREDKALVISDFTKGNPDRLGSAGAARPRLLHHKVHQIDCTPIVGGLVEHRYHLSGSVNTDIRQSIDGLIHGDSRRRRARNPDQPNGWVMA